MNKELPPLKFLKECFHYDPDTGDVLWKKRPLHHFSSTRIMNRCNSRLAGKPAGSFNRTSGHIQVGLRYDNKEHNYILRRIAYSLYHNRLLTPDEDITHTEGNALCCRGEKLTVITKNESQHNKVSISGFRGVSWHTQSGSWRACIKHQGKTHHLGLFSTETEASVAYMKAKRRLHTPADKVPQVPADKRSYQAYGTSAHTV